MGRKARRGRWGTCRWDLGFDGSVTVHEGVGWDTMGKSPWGPWARSVTSVSFDRGVVLPEDCGRLFAGLGSLRSVDAASADSSGVRSMRSMFDGCTALEHLDVSGWDVSNVKDMHAMFRRCGIGDFVIELDLGGWDVSGVEDMSGMFEQCHLRYLDVSGWDVSNVRNMHAMFSCCGIGGDDTQLDLSGWDVSRVKDMGRMFECGGADCLDLSGWDVSKVEEVGEMLYSTRERLDLSGWDVSDWTLSLSEAIGEGRMFGKGSLPRRIVADAVPPRWGTCAWELRDDGALVVHPGEGEDNLGGTCPWQMWCGARGIMAAVFEPGVRLPASCRDLFGDCEALRRVELGSCDWSGVTDTSGMFDGCKSLESLDASGWDVSGVTDMRGMFDGCEYLGSLDITGWDVSGVTNMSRMFEGCESLRELDLSGWDTSRVSAMYCMFEGCQSLESLDLSGWDVSGVTNMSQMFEGCESLRELDLSGWDTSRVSAMYCMFEGCQSLESLSLSEWDVSGATVWDMRDIFSGCCNLVALDLSGWDEPRARDMHRMLRHCVSLSHLQISEHLLQLKNRGRWGTCLWELKADGTLVVGAGEGADTCGSSPWPLTVSERVRSVVFESGVLLPADCRKLLCDFSTLESLAATPPDASKVVSMDAMFRRCTSLSSLDLSGWDVPLVRSASFCFSGCCSLERLDLGGWDVAQVEDMRGMFYGCSSLSSLDLSCWDTSRVVDAAYMFYGCVSLRELVLGPGYVPCSDDMIPSLPPGWDWQSESGGRVYAAGLAAWNRPCAAGSYRPAPLGASRQESPDDASADDWESDSTEVFRSGTWGTCAWEIGGDGTLVVHAGEGGDRRGLADVICESGATRVVCERGVVLPEECGILFLDCSSLVEIDLSKVDTSHVVDMCGMFHGCSSLKLLDLSGWDVSGVRTMAGIFEGCSSLKALNIARWDVSKVKCMDHMFTDCVSLRYLDLSDWAIADSCDTRGMFSGCMSLKGPDGSLVARRTAGGVLQGVVGIRPIVKASDLVVDAGVWGTCAWVLYGCGDLVVSAGTGVNTRGKNPWEAHSQTVASLTLEDGVVLPSDCDSLFHGLRYLTSVHAACVDTSSVTTMRNMFADCINLGCLDISNWDTSRVTSFAGMFGHVSYDYVGSLQSLDLSNWDTSRVKSLKDMFRGQTDLKSLNLGGWDTSLVRDMSRMFEGCCSLESVDVSGWDTSRVRDMGFMFYGCCRLRGFDPSHWDVSRVRRMGWMFQGCPLFFNPSRLKVLPDDWSMGRGDVLPVREVPVYGEGIDPTDLGELPWHVRTQIADYVRVSGKCVEECARDLGVGCLSLRRLLGFETHIVEALGKYYYPDFITDFMAEGECLDVGFTVRILSERDGRTPRARFFEYMGTSGGTILFIDTNVEDTIGVFRRWYLRHAMFRVKYERDKKLLWKLHREFVAKLEALLEPQDAERPQSLLSSLGTPVLARKAGESDPEVAMVPAGAQAVAKSATVSVTRELVTVSDPRLVPDATMRSGQVTTWDCVWLGTYPQSEVTPNDVDYASLEGVGWDTSGDAAVGGVRYRRISRSDTTCDDYWPEDAPSYRYFRWEPVKWRVLSVDGDAALAVADVAIDCRSYNENEARVSWGSCSLRSWLNGYGYDVNEPAVDYTLDGFVSEVFSNGERLAIRDESGKRGDQWYGDIYYEFDGPDVAYEVGVPDLVFLLWKEDVCGDAAVRHGFNANPEIFDEARCCKVSDYAHAMGAFRALFFVESYKEYNDNCYWWLRGSRSGRCSCCTVREEGDIDDYRWLGFVDVPDVSVRPALNLNLSSNLLRWAGTVSSDGTVNEVPWA